MSVWMIESFKSFYYQMCYLPSYFLHVNIYFKYYHIIDGKIWPHIKVPGASILSFDSLAPASVMRSKCLQRLSLCSPSRCIQKNWPTVVCSLWTSRASCLVCYYSLLRESKGMRKEDHTNEKEKQRDRNRVIHIERYCTKQADVKVNED